METPSGEAEACLTRNLRALERVQPELGARLRLPVDGEHLKFSQDGTPLYRLHGSWMPLVVPKSELPNRTAVPTDCGEVLLFGVGLGEQIDYLLRQRSDLSILAWDRDPWLLRAMLTQHDWLAAIAAGRLRFALGVDLCDAISEKPERRVIYHPFHQAVYTHERILVASGVGAKRAVIGLGGLFVDDLATSLRSEGFSVLPVDFERWSRDEIALAIKRFQPEVVALINYVQGLAEFCTERATKLLVWEIDSATDRLKPLESPAPEARVFSFRRANVEAYRQAGFEHTSHLPLASDTEKRCPLELNATELERYGTPVAFVGSSLVEHAESYRGIFLQLCTALDPEQSNEEDDSRLQLVLDVQREAYQRYMIPELMEASFPELLTAVQGSDFPHDPVLLVAEIAACEKRLAYVASLGQLGLHVWGDEGWARAEQYGVRYRGSASHHHELTRIYNAARIHVDVGRLYHDDVATMRVFDVLACGGFLIAERSTDLEQLFDVGVELEAYASLEELHSKVAYYLEHEQEARQIAARGLEAVRERHTIRQRVRSMLESAKIGLTPALGPG